MSNTLNTPIEALEQIVPLRIERYALRRGSGGTGAAPGGDGVIRRYRVLAGCRLSLMTERRGHGPRGAAGGGDGAPGRNLLNGRPLPAKLSRDVRAGDVVEIHTPGGGGYGRPGGCPSGR
jgi:N-methylhydantoinase B/oxoprolinase/acetone carboxylase alpha subunit